MPTDEEKLVCVAELMLEERGDDPFTYDEGEAIGGQTIGDDGGVYDPSTFPDDGHSFSVELWGHFFSNLHDDSEGYLAYYAEPGTGIEAFVRTFSLSAGGLSFQIDLFGNGFFGAGHETLLWYLPDGATNSGPDPERDLLHQWGWSYDWTTGQWLVFFDGEQVTPTGTDTFSNIGRRAYNLIESNADGGQRVYGTRSGHGNEFIMRIADIRVDTNLTDLATIEINFAAVCHHGGWSVDQIRF